MKIPAAVVEECRSRVAVARDDERRDAAPRGAISLSRADLADAPDGALACFLLALRLGVTFRVDA